MAWTQQLNIKGTKGDTGNAGIQGDPGTAGTAGAKGDRGTTWYTGGGAPSSVPGSLAGDLYLDTATGDVYLLS
jgi:hypothetical protein